jgi:hypothetical protein
MKIIRTLLITLLLVVGFLAVTPQQSSSALSSHFAAVTSLDCSSSTVGDKASCSKTGACKSLEIVGDQDCTTQGSKVKKVVASVVTILSIVAGIIAVIMILVSGLRYITSGGDAGKVGGAKNALVYALIGIAIAALAQVLVAFVLNVSDQTSKPCPTNSRLSVGDAACKT